MCKCHIMTFDKFQRDLFDYLNSLEKIKANNIEMIEFDEKTAIFTAWSPPPIEHLQGSLRNLLNQKSVLVIPAFEMDQTKAKIPNHKKGNVPLKNYDF